MGLIIFIGKNMWRWMLIANKKRKNMWQWMLIANKKQVPQEAILQKYELIMSIKSLYTRRTSNKEVKYTGQTGKHDVPYCCLKKYEKIMDLVCITLYVTRIIYNNFRIALTLNQREARICHLAKEMERV